jgi:hypothetical protein
MLYTASLLLIFWPLVQRILPFSNPTQLFGLCVALLATLVLDLAKRTGSQENSHAVPVQRLSIGGAIRATAEHRSSVTVLRVLASSTETILPALRDSPIRMKNCRVMVHDFSSRTDPEGRAQAAKAESLIRTWGELPQRKVADEVTVKRIQFIPTFFVVIFDNRALVHGLYVPVGRSNNATHYLEPMLIENKSPSSQEIIEMFIRQFDDIFEENAVYLRSSRRHRQGVQSSPIQSTP